MSDFEEQLSRLRLAEPSDGFEERVRSSIRSKKSRRLTPWVWGMAALLLMSISLNVYQLGVADPSFRSAEPTLVDSEYNGARVIQVQSVYVPGGQNLPDVKAKEYF